MIPQTQDGSAHTFSFATDCDFYSTSAFNGWYNEHQSFVLFPSFSTEKPSFGPELVLRHNPQDFLIFPHISYSPIDLPWNQSIDFGPGAVEILLLAHHALDAVPQLDGWSRSVVSGADSDSGDNGLCSMYVLCMFHCDRALESWLAREIIPKWPNYSG